MHLPGKFVEICKSLPCGETGVVNFGFGVPELHPPIEIIRHRFSIDLFFLRKVDWLPREFHILRICQDCQDLNTSHPRFRKLSSNSERPLIEKKGLRKSQVCSLGISMSLNKRGSHCFGVLTIEFLNLRYRKTAPNHLTVCLFSEQEEEAAALLKIIRMLRCRRVSPVV